MLLSSLMLRRKTLVTWVMNPALFSCLCGARGPEETLGMSPLLLVENDPGSQEVDEEKAREYQQIGPEILQPQCLGEGPDTDGLIPGRGKGKAQQPSAAGEGRDGHQQAGKIRGRDNRDDDGREY